MKRSAQKMIRIITMISRLHLLSTKEHIIKKNASAGIIDSKEKCRRIKNLIERSKPQLMKRNAE
jgi:hypothetical protein